MRNVGHPQLASWVAHTVVLVARMCGEILGLIFVLVTSVVGIITSLCGRDVTRSDAWRKLGNLIIKDSSGVIDKIKIRAEIIGFAVADVVAFRALEFVDRRSRRRRSSRRARERKATISLSFFLPSRHREEFVRDVLEDCEEMRAEGLSQRRIGWHRWQCFFSVVIRSTGAFPVNVIFKILAAVLRII